MPELLVDEARKAGVPYAAGCVIFQKETGGGQNIYGHDSGACFSFVNPRRDVEVTRENYAEYRKCVDAGGKRNGVGPVQITWWEFQDEADRRGGCWDPVISTRVGFEKFAGHLKKSGDMWTAFKRYNGKDSYANDAMRLLPRWVELCR